MAQEPSITPKRQSIGKETATYQTDSQDQLAAPRIDNAPLDPRYPGYFRLPGTSTVLRIGGFSKTDFIYDLKPAGDSERFIPSSFPIPATSSVNNTTVSIRPTRMSLDFLIPVSAISSSVRFFMEFDFLVRMRQHRDCGTPMRRLQTYSSGKAFPVLWIPIQNRTPLTLKGPTA